VFPGPGPVFPPSRLVDGLVGGGVALVLVRLLFPAAPARLVSAAARPLYDGLAAVLRQLADALERRDEPLAREVLRRAERLDDARLRDALALGTDIVRRAPLRRRRQDWLAPWLRAGDELRTTKRDVLVLAT